MKTLNHGNPSLQNMAIDLSLPEMAREVSLFQEDSGGRVQQDLVQLLK